MIVSCVYSFTYVRKKVVEPIVYSSQLLLSSSGNSCNVNRCTSDFSIVRAAEGVDRKTFWARISTCFLQLRGHRCGPGTSFELLGYVLGSGSRGWRGMDASLRFSTVLNDFSYSQSSCSFTFFPEQLNLQCADDCNDVGSARGIDVFSTIAYWICCAGYSSHGLSEREWHTRFFSA